MRKPLILLLALSATLHACATAPAPAQDVRYDGHTRLSQAVAPVEYAVSLQIDPAKDTFAGEVTITAKVGAPGVRRVMLHAESLKIEAASVADSAGQTVSATVEAGANGGVTLVVAQPLAQGQHKITLRYTGGLDEVPTGLYRVKDGERWYAFTQFEPLEARQAFPCFDEPGFKTPFTVSITTPAPLLAFANTPQTGVTEQGGTRTTTFARSLPLPTYLVAFAVGEFDVLEAPAGAIEGVPLRLIATKGKGSQGAWILGQTPAVLKALTDYFGMPYPYEKLDLVAVPNFSAGAMENVGLVTFREGLLLVDEALATPDMRRRSLSVLAHELAHMWFGNLVTPGWWDDLWLNESFATWLEGSIMARVAPELNPPTDDIEGMGWVMDADSREQTRAIRQPIKNGGDIYNAFDGITYSKGALVLRMVEAWLGAEVFRGAIQAYMKANRHGQVTSAALFAALDAASDKPVSRVMSSFIDRPGAPLVHVELACAGDKAQLKLSQRRYLPSGSKAAAQPEPWAIPMCLRLVADDGAITRECLLFDAASREVQLPSCPALVHPNDGEAGYYHWSVPAAQLDALVDAPKALSAAEQLGLLIHMDALVASGALRALKAWQATIALASRPSAAVQLKQRLVGTLADMEEGARRTGQLDAWRVMLSEVLGPMLEEVGVEPAADEDPLLTSYRIDLLGTLGRDARAPYVLATAQAVLAAFLETPEQVPAGRLRWALSLAAEDGDTLLWERLQKIALETNNPAVRGSALYALGAFRDPALQDRSLALILDPRVRSNELWALYGPSMRDPALYARAWAWFKANYPAVVSKIGEKAAPGLPRAGGGFCDAAGQADVKAFFEGLAAKPDGKERNLSQTLERIGACEVQVNATLEDLRELLGDKKP